MSGLRFLAILVISIPSLALGQSVQPTGAIETKLVSIEAKVEKLQTQKIDKRDLAYDFAGLKAGNLNFFGIDL